MNDGLYHPFSEERFLAYQTGLKALINRAKASGAHIIVLTPPPFDPQSIPTRKTLLAEGKSDYGFKTPYKDYNQVLKRYRDWIMTLKFPKVTPIDIHTPFQSHVTLSRVSNSNYTLSSDGIHPNPLGHHLMARTILKQLQLFKDPNSLQEADFLAKKDPLFNKISKRTAMRSNGWLEYVGYTRARKTVKTDSIEEIEAQAQNMQKEINKLRNS